MAPSPTTRTPATAAIPASRRQARRTVAWATGALALVLCLPGLPLAATDVPSWQPIDLPFTAAEPANPFTQDFSATVTGPGGISFTSLGFFDGNGTWKIRVGPSALGSWSVTTVSSNPALNGRTASFVCVANTNANVHGALRVDAQHPNHFVYEDGTRYHLQGYEADWLWAIDMTTSPLSANVTTFLDQALVANGFNHVMVNAYAYDTTWMPGTTSAVDYGPPALLAWPGTKDAPDFSRFTLPYWQHYDQMMEALRQRGLIAHMYIRVYNKQVVWPANASAYDDLYWKWLVARYGAYPNVVWDMSKEWQNEPDLNYKINRLHLVANNDPYHRLRTVHDDAANYGSYVGLVDFRTDQNTSGSYHNQVVSERVQNWPVMNEEYGYEIGIDGGHTYPPVQAADEVMRRAWEITMGGGYAGYYYTYTAWDVFHAGDRPAGYGYFNNLQRFFAQAAYWTLSPADSLVSNGGHCLADAGREYLVYQTTNAAFTLTPSGLATPLRAQWFNPRTGAQANAPDIVNGTNTLTPPAGWNEVALHVVGASGTNQPPVVDAGAAQTITLPTTSANLSGSATDPDGTISGYAWTQVSGGAATIVSPTSAATQVTGLTTGSYTFRLTATDNLGATGSSDVVVTVNASAARGPFGGTARSITSVIQAEDYDTGGEGVAYHDLTPANEGGAYRTDAVDIEPCADTGGGFDVGWVLDGEWLEYTVTVPTAGAWAATIRTASATAGGTIALSLDGRALASVAVAATGGWQAWQSSTSAAIDLPSGTHVLRLFFSGGSGYLFNVNSIAFASVTTATPTVTGFTLIDARTDQPVPGFDPLPANATIDTSAIGTTQLNLRANVAGGVTAVRFDLDGVVGYRTETVAPYALAGDVAGHYQPWTLANGQHTVVATPSAGSAVGPAVSLTFTLASGAAVTGFTLIDARTDQPVPGFDPLPANATIDTGAIGTTQLNLRANTVGTVASVRFGLDGVASYHVENVAPWALAGDNAGRYLPWTLGAGVHDVVATPFAGTGATGTAGTAASARFTIVTPTTSSGGSAPVAAAASAPSTSSHGCGRGGGIAAFGLVLTLIGQVASRRRREDIDAEAP